MSFFAKDCKFPVLGLVACLAIARSVYSDDCCMDTCVSPPPCSYAYLEAAKCSVIELNGDVLFWKAQEDSLNYGSIETTREEDGVEASTKKQQQLKADWNVGFRLGAGYVVPWRSWDIYASWLSYDAHANKSFTSVPSDELEPGSPAFFPTWVVGGLSDPDLGLVQTAKGQWKLMTNVVDLEFGYNFLITDNFSFRPHIGLSGADINQRFNINVDQTVFDDSIDAGEFSALDTGQSHEDFLIYS